MSEKRFAWDGDILFDSLELRELGNCLEARDIADLLNELYEEKEQMKKRLESSEATSDATSNYNAFLESKITTLEKENEMLRKSILYWEKKYEQGTETFQIMNKELRQELEQMKNVK